MALKECQGYSCVVILHKQELLRLSTEDLLAKRRDLANSVEEMEQVLLGSLAEQTRRCGKAGCRCATDRPHGPYVFLCPRRHGAGMRYVPAGMVASVRAFLERGDRIEALLAAISAINLELLARRHLI